MSDTTTLAQRLTGKVKWFNNKSGFGFITVCDGEYSAKDIFVHFSSIRGDNSFYKYLVQGEYVDFDLVKSTSDKHEYHAVDITGIKNGEIMCQTRKLADTAVRPRPPVRKYRTRPPESNDQDRSTEEDSGFVKVQRKSREPRA
jgi:CspA family cold shock protein